MQSQTSPNKGTKSKVVTSPLPSPGPERGRYCYVTTAFSGVPNAKRGEQNQKCLPHPCLLGGPQMGGNATSPLHSRGSPTPTRGTKSEVVASPPPSPGPTNARNCCVTHAISSVPKQGNKIKSGYLTPAFSGARKRAVLLRNHCILGGPQRQARGTKSKKPASPLPSRGPTKLGKMLHHTCHSRGSPTPRAGNKIRSGCLTTAFSGAHKWAEMLRDPCILGVVASPLPSRGPERGRYCYVTPAFSGVPNAKRMRTKSEVPALPLPSRGPTNGRKCYITLAFSGVPNANAWNKIRSGCLTTAFSGAHKCAELLCNPCNLKRPQTREQNRKWLPHHCLLGGRKRAVLLRNHCILGGPQRQARGTKSEVPASPLPSRGPTNGRKCYITLAILGGAQHQGRGTKSEVLASPLPSRGPERGRYCYVTPAFSGVPNASAGEQNQKCLPHPCLLAGPQMGRNATSPLHSRGSPTPTRGTKSEVVASPPPSPGPTNARNCGVTHAISSVPKQGNKIKSGCLTTAFSGPRKRAVLLRKPCILGGPQRQARGTKSEVPASPLPSRGPTNGRKCYITLAFSGVPCNTCAICTAAGSVWHPIATLMMGRRVHPNRAMATPTRGTKSDVVASPPPSPGPTNARNCCVTHAISNVPKQGNKIKSGYLTNAFSGARKRAVLLRNHCVLGGPQRQARGTKSKVPASSLPSLGPTNGRKCYITLAFSGVPNTKGGEQNQKWLPHHCLLGARKRAVLLRNPCILGAPQRQAQENKIRSGCLTTAFSGAHKCAELLCNPCNPKRPQTREQNQKWLPHPCLLGGPKEGGIAT